jgi:hypothetical protein
MGEKGEKGKVHMPQSCSEKIYGKPVEQGISCVLHMSYIMFQR